MQYDTGSQTSGRLATFPMERPSTYALDLVHQQPIKPVAQFAPKSAMCVAVYDSIMSMSRDLLCEEGIHGLAKDTFYSRFHFTREFTKRTGTTPRRFLAALRMQEAKRLLLTTEFSVADLSNMVGYSSVGTFSSRFSALVGVSPTTWRTSRGQVEPMAAIEGTGTHRIRGNLNLPRTGSCPDGVFVGVFADTIMQGRPIACTRVADSGSFEVRGVPSGHWYVVAFGTSTCDENNAQAATEIRGHVEVTLEQGTTALVSLDCRHVTPLDPPVIHEGLGGSRIEVADVQPLPVADEDGMAMPLAA